MLQRLREHIESLSLPLFLYFIRFYSKSGPACFYRQTYEYRTELDLIYGNEKGTKTRGKENEKERDGERQREIKIEFDIGNLEFRRYILKITLIISVRQTVRLIFGNFRDSLNDGWIFHVPLTSFIRPFEEKTPRTTYRHDW